MQAFAASRLRVRLLSSTRAGETGLTRSREDAKLGLLLSPRDGCASFILLVFFQTIAGKTDRNGRLGRTP